jgi:hypothetical protein
VSIPGACPSFALLDIGFATRAPAAGTFLPIVFSRHLDDGVKPAPREKAMGNTVPAGAVRGEDA